MHIDLIALGQLVLILPGSVRGIQPIFASWVVSKFICYIYGVYFVHFKTYLGCNIYHHDTSEITTTVLCTVSMATKTCE